MTSADECCKGVGRGGKGGSSSKIFHSFLFSSRKVMSSAFFSSFIFRLKCQFRFRSARCPFSVCVYVRYFHSVQLSSAPQVPSRKQRRQKAESEKVSETFSSSASYFFPSAFIGAPSSQQRLDGSRRLSQRTLSPSLSCFASEKRRKSAAALAHCSAAPEKTLCSVQ